MSFFKFWGKKPKAKEDVDQRKEETDPDAEKRKLRHSLSISRSGRFKQKNRERGGILDRPELYGAEQGEEFKEHSAYSETSSSASTTSTSSAMSSASSGTATGSSRDPSAPYIDPRQGNRRAGRSMAT